MFENTEFRRLDVDSIDPENYEDVHHQEEAVLAGPNEEKVRDSLGEMRHEEALFEVLKSNPYSLSQTDKDRLVLLVASILHTFPNSNCASTIQKLTVIQADLLLKYVYKAMELVTEQSVLHVLLEWHSGIFQVYGHGAIVRVLAERRRL